MDIEQVANNKHNHDLFITPDLPRTQTVYNQAAHDDIARDIDDFIKRGGKIRKYGIDCTEIKQKRIPVFVCGKSKKEMSLAMRVYGLKDQYWTTLKALSELTIKPCILVVVGDYEDKANLKKVVNAADDMAMVDLRFVTKREVDESRWVFGSQKQYGTL